MQIAILGIPMDLGAGRRGVDMGPSALRYAKLVETLRELGHDVQDLGNVIVPVVESIERNGNHPHYLEEIRAACQDTAQQLRKLEPGVIPICIGGDHSISMGTVAGTTRGERRGLIWVDAHTDFNTPGSSPSGNIHGMPVAHLIGLGDERLITAFTMADIDRLGMARIADQTLERLSHLQDWHVSFDADSLDPGIAPGVGTPVKGGLTYREAHLLMEFLAQSGRVKSLDLVEVNPVLDNENMTANVMVEMTSSLLGKRIL
jgi:arginase